MWCFINWGGCFEKNCANAPIVYEMFIVCSYLSGSIEIVRKERYERRCNGVYLYHYTYNFFITIAPEATTGASPRFGPFGLFLWGDGGRDGLRRGSCMVVPGAVVSPGLTKSLSLLPCRAPLNSPCTLMRTWLRQMGLTLRLVAAEYLPVRSLRRWYDQRLTPTHRVPTMQPPPAVRPVRWREIKKASRL